MLNPHLPEASPDLGPYHTRQHRANGGCNFHRACLELSQSLWLQEKPAQAILQLNKASMIPEQAAPYPALVWPSLMPAIGARDKAPDVPWVSKALRLKCELTAAVGAPLVIRRAA